MKARSFVATAAVAALALTLIGGRDGSAQQPAPKPAPPPPAPVALALAQSVAMVPEQFVPGTIVSREDARLSTEPGGLIERLAEVGDTVRKGEVLARVDDEALSLRARDEAANVKRIEAQLDYAERQLQRLSALEQQSSVARNQLDESRSNREMLRQDLERARVALEQTRRQIREATLRAPFAGIVAERYAQRGERVAPGAPVLRLVNPRALEIRAQAPVAMGATLSAGTQVTVRAGDRIEREALRAVVPVGDVQSRQLEVRVALHGEWPVGSAVDVGLPTGAGEAVVAVPRDALVLREEGTYVFRVDAQNKAERVAVVAGASQGELVAVRGAVAAGDRLVVRGGERLSTGQAVVARDDA